MTRGLQNFDCMYILCCLVLLTWHTAGAQSTSGSIYGQITDASGAIMVGAQITAVNQTTGVTYKGQSDAAGNYAVFDSSSWQL